MRYTTVLSRHIYIQLTSQKVVLALMINIRSCMLCHVVPLASTHHSQARHAIWRLRLECLLFQDVIMKLERVKQGASKSAAFAQTPVDQTNCLKQKGIVSVTPKMNRMLASQRFARRRGHHVETPLITSSLNASLYETLLTSKLPRAYMTNPSSHLLPYLPTIASVALF
jgi:hypothetical protein